MQQYVYIVGHKNPDTDSICSALAYAELKQRLGVHAIPCRLGPLNEETKYVLKRFGLENPLLLKDARSQLRDIDIDEPTLITTKTSLKEAWDVLFKARNKSLFVLDEQQKLTGIVSTSNLASPRMMSDELMHKLMKTASLSALATPSRTSGIRSRHTSQEMSKRIPRSVCVFIALPPPSAIAPAASGACENPTCGPRFR